MNARRDAWLAENGPCARCGSAEELQVDHVDPESKQMNPALLWSLSPKNPKRISELAKCQVLCRPCHDPKSRLDLSLKLGGVRAKNASLDSAMLAEVKRRLAAGERGVSIAASLGVSKYVVSRVKRGETYIDPA
jgi:hypothetical protein